MMKKSSQTQGGNVLSVGTVGGVGFQNMNFRLLLNSTSSDPDRDCSFDRDVITPSREEGNAYAVRTAEAREIKNSQYNFY